MRASPNRFLAVLIGAISLVIAVLGFASTFDVGFTASEGTALLGIFEVNDLQNTVHLLIGAALFLAGQAGLSAARKMNVAMGSIYALIGILGLFLLEGSDNFLAVSAGGNVFHFASGAVLLGVALAAERDASGLNSGNRDGA